MVVHPSPPADVPGLVEAYRQTVTSFADVADGFREEEWDLPVSCPGWSVRDVLAHVVHVEDYLAGSDHPVTGWVPDQDEKPVRVGAPEHVRSDFGVWVEEGVRARRDRDPRELVAELRGLIDVRSAAMYDTDLEMDTPVRTVMGGQDRFSTITRMRLNDIWVHEQDLREAVDRPGSLDTAGASQFTAGILRALSRVVMDRVGPEPGTVVILESTGPVTGRAGVRVATDADGKPVAHRLFTGHAEDEAEEDADGVASVPEEIAPEVVTTIALSTYELTRRAAGRRFTEDTAYQVIGDEDLARRVLDALVLTP